MLSDDECDMMSPDPRRVYFRGKESSVGVSPIEVEKIVEVEKQVVVEKIVEVEKPVIVEKIVEVIKVVEVEKPVVVEKIVVKEIPFKTVIEETIIEPSLKAEEELLKVYAEIAKLNKKNDEAQEEANVNQRFLKGAFLIIFLFQFVNFWSIMFLKMS